MKALVVSLCTPIHLFQDQDQANAWYQKTSGDGINPLCYDVELHTPATIYQVRDSREDFPSTIVSTHWTYESAIKSAMRCLASIIPSWIDLGRPATVRWDEDKEELVIIDSLGNVKDSSYHEVHIVELEIT